MEPLAPKSVAESVVEATELILPGHTNPLGTAFGGRVMALIDITAGVAASRHARAVVVTVGMDEMHFRAPVRLGDILILKASVNFAGTTSMEVGVRVEREDPLTGERLHTATAYLTFVALDENRQPRPVPPLIAGTDEERRRMDNARIRRAERLRKRDLYRAAPGTAPTAPARPPGAPGRPTS
jgi:acyl-CoA hydrolase